MSPWLIGYLCGAVTVGVSLVWRWARIEPAERERRLELASGMPPAVTMATATLGAVLLWPLFLVAGLVMEVAIRMGGRS